MQRVYEDHPFPLGDYATARVWVNPPTRVLRDYEAGLDLTAAVLEQTAAEADRFIAEAETEIPKLVPLSKPRLDYEQARAEWIAIRDVSLPAARERYDRCGQALVELYRECQIAGFDFATPEAAMQSLDEGREDVPFELVFWLRELPGAVVRDRRAVIEKKVGRR